MLAEADKQGITTWVEPFVGGGNVIDKVPSSYNRIGYDLNEHTIAAMVAIRDMVDQLPTEVSKEHYDSIKGEYLASPINSWIRFVSSFSGKLDNGYARQGNNTKYRSSPTAEGRRNALKQSPNIQTVEFVRANYKDIITMNSLIYCDPPYQGTTRYKTGAFNHEEFFQWCRDMRTKGNIVFVSEYNAPDDFELVWQGEVKTNFSSTRKEATHTATEKLFKL